MGVCDVYVGVCGCVGGGDWCKGDDEDGDESEKHEMIRLLRWRSDYRWNGTLRV